MKPFVFFDYNKFQKNTFCVLCDSGTLSDESSILRFPAVLIRTSTEIPEVLDKGYLFIGGISTETFIQSVNMAFAINENKEISIEAEDYSDDSISIKVVKIIQSYRDIINRTVWLKG